MIGCDNVWSCCSSASPCNVNQGDCDTNEDCIGDLVCGISNCIGSEFPANVDCCESQGNLPWMIFMLCSNLFIASKFMKLVLGYLVGWISIFDAEITFHWIDIQNIPKNNWCTLLYIL